MEREGGRRLANAHHGPPLVRLITPRLTADPPPQTWAHTHTHTLPCAREHTHQPPPPRTNTHTHTHPTTLNSPNAVSCNSVSTESGSDERGVPLTSGSSRPPIRGLLSWVRPGPVQLSTFRLRLSVLGRTRGELLVTVCAAAELSAFIESNRRILPYTNSAHTHTHTHTHPTGGNHTGEGV